MAAVNIHANVPTDFSHCVREPEIHVTAYVHPLAAVIGVVTLGQRVFVAPFASVRGDEGMPIFVGDESNVQDGVVIHGLESEEIDSGQARNLELVQGHSYAVYIGRQVSLAHQCQIHGPAVVQDNTFVGMQSLVFKSRIGRGCVIEPGAKVMGVQIAEGRYVQAGRVVRTQQEADALPLITPEYDFYSLNDALVHVNTQLAGGYRTAAGGPNVRSAR